MLLAIDTATRCASLALYDGAGVVSERTWRSRNNHSREVVPAIGEMLAQQGMVPSELGAVAVTCGPGSFTGLRIGLSVAKGLCFALDIPILGIPTLDVIAYAVGEPGTPVLAVLEAGRGRICVRPYRVDEGWPEPIGEMRLLAAEEWVVEADGPVLVAGEVGAGLAERLMRQPNAQNIGISSLAASVRRAGYLAELAWERLEAGRVDELDGLTPVYAHTPVSGSVG